jgi:ABC-2 type transport system permease protein
MNAATETSESFSAPATAPRPVRPFYWSVRRELWENRSLFIAPLAAAGLGILSMIVRAVHEPDQVMLLAALTPDQQRFAMTLAHGAIAYAISIVMSITVFFYLLDALQGERKDRSVLFWKSMPVSDTTTVLSKLFTALVISGAIVIVLATVTMLLGLLGLSVVLMIGGHNPLPLLGDVQLFQMTAAIIYWQIGLALWYAPVAAWVLLVSAWAKRVTILWAVFTTVAVVVLERVALGTHYVQDLITYRLRDVVITAIQPRARGQMTIDGDAIHARGFPARVFDAIDPVAFFTNPWLWVGLIVAAGFVAAAIWMRRYREPI